MTPSRVRDIAAGTALAVFGVWYAAHAAQMLPLGSFDRMGSGMFPFLTGAALAITGMILAATRLADHRRDRPETADEEIVETPQWLSLLVVTAAIASFALLVRPFGIGPATIALVMLSALASRRLKLWVALVLALGLILLAWLIFVLGLGLPFHILQWSF